MYGEVDILDTNNLQLKGDFDNQVHRIMSFVRLDFGTAQQLYQVLLRDVQFAMQQVRPGCYIEPYGSLVTGLGIHTSDVDCYVALPFGEKSKPKHILLAKDILDGYSNVFTQVIAITTARVPIVKFFHIPTQRHGDINFKTRAGVENSKLITFLLRYDDRALPLAVLIKYWSKIHQFTGTYRLSNYALTMMVIFYLQLMGILPSVYELQRDVPSYFVEGWNTAIDERWCRSRRNFHTLYELVGGFFKFYQNFNFTEDFISPFLGRVMNKNRFNQLDIPSEFFLYKEKLTNDVCTKFRTNSRICIQDPFEHSKNCSHGQNLDSMAERIMSHFEFASNMFEECYKNNFLRAIFTGDPHSIPSAPVMIGKYTNTNRIRKGKFKQKKKAQSANKVGFHHLMSMRK